MKKLLLSILAAAATASASVGQVTQVEVPQPRINQSQGFDFTPVRTASKMQKAPLSRAEGDGTSLDFTLAFEPYTALRNSQLSLGTEIYQAIEFSPENCELYDGTTLTSINITTGAYGNTETNGVVNVTVFLADDIAANFQPFYTQTAKLGQTAFEVNKIELDTTFVIEKGKPFVLGYYCKPISQYDYYLVVDGVPREDTAGGHYGYKSGRRLFWDNIAEYYGNLCIGATLKGDNLPENGVSLYNFEVPSYVEPGKEFELTTYFVGAAANDANSVDLEYTIGSQAPKTVHLDFQTPLGYNNTVGYCIPGLVCNETGSVPFKLEITKVNGADNISTQNSGSSSFNCFEASKGFTRRFVVEEGTGTWCGWCPSGMVMMEYLRDNYPTEFIRVAVHSGYGTQAPDPMQVPSTASVLNYFEGFPTAMVNRAVAIGPTAEGVLDYLTQYYDANKSIPAMVDFTELSAEFTGDNEISINATAQFAIDYANNNRYRMAFYLTEDGVGPYEQHNYYAGGGNGTMGGWENKGEYVDILFDDVARLLLGTSTGFSNSIPASFKAGESCEYTTTASTAAITGTNFFLTAMIVDNQRDEIVNAKQIQLSKTGGVADVTTGSLAVKGAHGCIEFSGEYTVANVYSIAGQLVATACGESSIELPAGLYIVKADGCTAKVVVK